MGFTGFLSVLMLLRYDERNVQWRWSLDVLQAADDGGRLGPLGAEEPQHGRAVDSSQGGERGAVGAMEQREEERTRGMDTHIMSGLYHFNVDGRCGWLSLVTTVKSCRRKMFGIHSGFLRLTQHHLKQEVHRLPREALAPPFGDGM